MSKSHSTLTGTRQIIYQTTGKASYPIEIGYRLFSSELVPVDKRITSAACLKGCRLFGRNGGCPPFSPEFDQISGKQILILYAKIRTCHYPLKVLNGPYYVRWVFVETFLSSMTNRLGKSLSKNLSGSFLSSGNCHGCRPKPCAFKEGKKCRNPTARTFSLESTGVIVTELMKQCFGMELQWWQRDNPSYIPEFMVKVVGIKKVTRDDFIIKQAIDDVLASYKVGNGK